MHEVTVLPDGREGAGSDLNSHWLEPLLMHLAPGLCEHIADLCLSHASLNGFADSRRMWALTLLPNRAARVSTHPRKIQNIASRQRSGALAQPLQHPKQLAPENRASESQVQQSLPGLASHHFFGLGIALLQPDGRHVHEKF